MLGYEVTSRFGGQGLPDDTIRLRFEGSAGQSFGAFIPRGITMTLEGDANDHVGKGLSGGRIVVYPPKRSTFAAEENIIVGNVALYGATSGEAFFRGVAGERFAVRNSGATAVVEGVGDHGCEYMTGGRVVVLGKTGRNFAAGMSGGVAYVLDLSEKLAKRANRGMCDLEAIDDEDEAFLRRIVCRHIAFTNSAHASHLLFKWAQVHEALGEGDAARLQARAAGRSRRAEGRAAWPSSASWWARPMGKPTGFIEIARKKQPTRPVAERVRDWQEVYLPYGVETLRQQGARCMDCGIPFCHQGCPLGNLIPDWNDLVYHDRWQTAIERLLATNNFPEFTGRLCPAPCEGVVRPRHQRRPGDHQGHRERDHRARVRRRLDRAASAGASHRQAHRRRRIGPGGTGRGRPVEQGRPPGHRVRARRPHRRAASLRHPRVQDGEARPRSAPLRHGGRRA